MDSMTSIRLCLNRRINKSTHGPTKESYCSVRDKDIMNRKLWDQVDDHHRNEKFFDT